MRWARGDGATPLSTASPRFGLRQSGIDRIMMVQNGGYSYHVEEWYMFGNPQQDVNLKTVFR